MIRFIASSDPRFKGLKFERGMNVVLADKTQTSTDQQTRNGSGKSSLIRLIHFLLGGNASPSSMFRQPALADQTFVAGLDLRGLAVSIARSGRTKGVHLYSELHTDCVERHAIPILDSLSYDPSGWERVSIDQWRQRISSAFFGIAPDLPKNAPSSRSLLSYLARRVEDGGFHTPFKHSSIQQTVDQQVALSFLLDLDWEIPQQLESIREEEKTLKALRKAAREGSLGHIIGTSAKLRTELILAREHANDVHRQASEFRVIDGYSKIEREADVLTRELRDLRDADAVDRDLLQDIANTDKMEYPPDIAELQRLWSHVNILLPLEVRETYSEVHEFHQSVIRNRKLYLEREASEAQERISARSVRRQHIDARRAELMRILTSGGALEQFAALEAEVARAQTDVRQLEEQYKLAETIEGDKARLESQRRELLLRLQGDHHDREDRLAKAISRFESYSTTLYEERRGSLVVEETLNGPRFDVEIAGKGSVGIDSMQILCFDLMITTLLQERGLGPAFLVHDSHIFDGVDERQVASALMLGARLSDEYGFQYLVTMNSDSVPEFPSDFNFGAVVNEVKLTDALEDGGLFGFKFD